jgi:hypothetical protein
MQLPPNYSKPWAHVTDPQVGDIVRIKQVPGSRYASKRCPIWGIVRQVTKRPADSVIESTVKVRPVHSDNPLAMKHMTPDPRYWEQRGREFTVDARFRDVMPAPKSIPPVVRLAVVKDRLRAAVRLDIS